MADHHERAVERHCDVCIVGGSAAGLAAALQLVRQRRSVIVIDSGEGTRTYEVTATRAGRRVDIANRRGIIEVSEVTRTGTAVRTARFMASRVVALVEHPADTTGAD